jgi:5-methylthioadenosine/S-adenosylhomocysteine deaminase
MSKSSTESLLIKNACVVTLDAANNVYDGDVFVEQGRIAALGSPLSERAYHAAEVIDARGSVLLPGFVQTHVHLCQTLFRGAADDLALIDWLKKRVWLMEAAHTAESVYASARLGIAELIRGGTTCALTMETVQHTDAVFKAVEEAGFRATVGKCMMDTGSDVPEELLEQTEASIAESLDLISRWHGQNDNRIRCCLAPRFALSCSRNMLQQIAQIGRDRNVIIHTHASENKQEIEMVRLETGALNIEYFDEVGLTGSRVVLAHCVHVVEGELEVLARTGTHVAHCPSSNLKLGSGFAPIPEMIRRGISVSLGADGAACNNRLDMFTEMRTAALMQKGLHGAETLPALSVLRMATINGARAMGLENEIGSIEVGKRADLTVVNTGSPHTTPHPDPISTIVYAAEASDVVTVLIDGRIVMRDRQLTTLDEPAVLADAMQRSNSLRAAISASSL